MKKSLSKVWKRGLTLLFGIVVWLFWWLRYPFALSYQEQFQLFLLDDDYFMSRMAEPGGLARYVAEFLVQFYNVVVVGAAIIAVLLVLMQLITWRLMRSKVHNPLSIFYYPLSFLPALFVWYMMGDENLLLGFVVSLDIVLAVMLLSLRLNIWWNILLIVITYWIAGPLFVILACWVAGLSLYTQKYTILPVIVCPVVVWLNSFVSPYPVRVLWGGLGYYRFQGNIPTLKGYKARTYELIEYDYLVRQGRWDDIIAKADQKSPDLPMSVCANNLALAMKGELGERAFDYYQNGTVGLLPKFERNFNSLLVTGEAYFQLGLVNTAQRFAFEAMEAIPNCEKSARCIRRLAETNLINGQYDVARKYLKMLEKTLFYSKWARRTMNLLGNEEAINQHPLYGHMRTVRLTDDLLFSDKEIDKICGQLVMQSCTNHVAVQYLLLYPLLQRDINKFMNYQSFVAERTQYNPRSCQEAVAFAYASRQQQPPQGAVSPSVLQHFNQFSQAYRNHALLEMYKNTVWYYLMEGK